MIGQRTFESLLSARFAASHGRFVPLSELKEDGWDIETLLELVSDYKNIPPEHRHFEVSVLDCAPTPQLRVSRKNGD